MKKLTYNNNDRIMKILARLHHEPTHEAAQQAYTKHKKYFQTMRKAARGLHFKDCLQRDGTTKQTITYTKAVVESKMFLLPRRRTEPLAYQVAVPQSSPNQMKPEGRRENDQNETPISKTKSNTVPILRSKECALILLYASLLSGNGAVLRRLNTLLAREICLTHDARFYRTWQCLGLCLVSDLFAERQMT